MWVIFVSLMVPQSKNLCKQRKIEWNLSMPLSTKGPPHLFNSSRSPQFGMGWRGRLHSVQTAQLWNRPALEQLDCDTAWLRKSTAVRQLNSDAGPLCHSTGMGHRLWGGSGKTARARGPWRYSSTPVQKDSSNCSGRAQMMSQLQPGTSSLQWKLKSMLLQDRGEAGLHGEESLSQVPDWSTLMQMRTPNVHKSTVQKAVS